MPNYQDGKIYKLVSNISNDIYIGSTVNKLSHRLHHHKKKDNTCVSKQLFANDAVIQIILIESCPCNNKSELKAREHHYITTLVCINKRIPFITDIAVVNGDQKEWHKAYRAFHAVEIAANKKVYNDLHANEIADKQKAYKAIHAVEIAANKKVYNALHANEIAAKQKAYKAIHAVEIAAQLKIYRELHADEIAAKQKAYKKAYYLKKKSLLDQTLEV